jgi:glycosyltransferase involved in cell wall biosynthesis
MRLVTTVHGWVEKSRRTELYFPIDRFCLRHYEKIVCVSDDLYNRCLECGVPRSRCVLVRNAIDMSEYSPRLESNEAKRRMGIAPGRILIGSVGRLAEEKRFDLLIRAVGSLIKRGLNVEAVVAGDGRDRTRLQSVISELGCDERIRLLGHCADPRSLYEAMDVFVLSSEREGLPNALLEAMAMEVPVVATRVGGIPQLIRHAQDGFLVEPGDVVELTDTLEQILRDADLRNRFAKAGRERVERDFSFEVRMQKIHAVYQSVLNGN